MPKEPRPVSAATRAMLDGMDEMRADSKPKQDKLDRLRNGISSLRDMEIEKAQKEARIAELSEMIRTMKEKTLVDLFDEAGTSSIGIVASGNLPPYECELGDYYHANIKADAPPAQREAAFKYLRDKGHGDLIKTTFTISFGMGEAKATERFRRSLAKAEIPFEESNGVPWNTLTAWLKVEHKKKPLTVKAMELLGATVGRVVKVIKQKDNK